MRGSEWVVEDAKPAAGAPTLEPDLLERKIYHLLANFATQRDKRWFDDETFRGLARLRGVEAGVRYAEAFYSRKAVL